jgi:dihydroorotase
MGKIIISNGKTYDPLLDTYSKRDIYISDDIIVDHYDQSEADILIDGTEYIVTPGLIDHHIHLYQGSDGGVNPDLACLPNGVTTAVDGGSCGISNYTSFHNISVINSLTTIKSYLNIAPIGLGTKYYPENLDIQLLPQYYDLIKECFKKYRGEIISLKIRLTKDVTSQIEPLKYCTKLADEIGCNVVVHVTNPSVPTEEIAAVLRPGDVFCHMYQGIGNTILDVDGKVKKDIYKAKRRGVLFDACNGKKNFAFSVAIPAIRQGFLPDIISTDMSPMTFYNDPVISMPYVMSKYLAFGLRLEEIMKMVVLNPAKILGLEKQYATLKVGTPADIAIFQIVDKNVKFYDCNNEFIEGNQVIVPQLTIKGGVIVYRQSNFVSVKCKM